MPVAKRPAQVKKTNVKKVAKADSQVSEERAGEISRAISIIESKPHMLYVRYLLTKRFGVRYINNELYRLGLSAASEKSLADYYLAVVDPVIRKHGLSKVYADYKKIAQNIVAKGKADGVSCETLSYRWEISKNEDLSAKFCFMINDLDITKIWSSEIYKAHGSSVDNLPTDKDGVRIIPSTSLCLGSVDKVLLSDYRSQIEEMILEGIADKHIEETCARTFKQKITAEEISTYRYVFFNMQLNTLEKNIEALQSEKNALIAVLKDLQRGIGRFKDISIGDKKTYNDILTERINSLQVLLRSYQKAHTDGVFQRSAQDITSAEKIFTDIMLRASNRFLQLDEYSDRDVPAVQAQIMRIMTMAYDKAVDARDRMPHGGAGQKSVNEQQAELYKQRLEEIYAQDKEKANEALKQAGIEPFSDEIDFNEIGGIEELGVNYNAGEDEGGE